MNSFTAGSFIDDCILFYLLDAGIWDSLCIRLQIASNYTYSAASRPLPLFNFRVPSSSLVAYASANLIKNLKFLHKDANSIYGTLLSDARNVMLRSVMPSGN